MHKTSANLYFKLAYCFHTCFKFKGAGFVAFSPNDSLSIMFQYAIILIVILLAQIAGVIIVFGRPDLVSTNLYLTFIV